MKAVVRGHTATYGRVEEHSIGEIGVAPLGEGCFLFVVYLVGRNVYRRVASVEELACSLKRIFFLNPIEK